jgi:DNA-binding transcriptional MerR regulator
MTLEKTEFSLAELAATAGVPGRTIRYYIARNLLPGPLKAGRDAVYGAEHLQRLREILRLQNQGRTLLEIARQVEGKPEAVAVAEPAPWWQYQLAGDVVVSVRGDVTPWRMRQIKKCIALMAAGLGETVKN